MVRIRIPNGVLGAGQLRAIADLSRRFGRGVADITVRQNIQLHWVTPESLPEVLETLAQHGLTSIGACGDVVRNITGCPVAGFDADEICDPSPLAIEASHGLTREEIGEVLLHTAVYGGVPAANRAFAPSDEELEAARTVVAAWTFSSAAEVT